MKKTLDQQDETLKKDFEEMRSWLKHAETDLGFAQKDLLDFEHGWSNSATHMSTVQRWVRTLTVLARRIQKQIPKVQRAHGFNPKESVRGPTRSQTAERDHASFVAGYRSESNATLKEAEAAWVEANR